MIKKNSGHLHEKKRTTLEKLEEFFSTSYKDEVFKILEKYPNERSITIDFNDLETFDHDLAELLIEKPEEIIYVSQKAIKNIDPLVKDADINIRIKNNPNKIDLNDINSRLIGKLITTNIHVSKLEDITPQLKLGVFECRCCMRLHSVEQEVDDRMTEPVLCSECGSKSFRLLSQVSKYEDMQIVKVDKSVNDSFPELFILTDDLCGTLNENDYLEVTGILKVDVSKKSLSLYMIVNSVEVTF